MLNQSIRIISSKYLHLHGMKLFNLSVESYNIPAIQNYFECIINKT